MKKHTLLTLFLGFSFAAYLQAPPFNEQEKKIEYCDQHIFHQKMLSDSAYVRALRQDSITRLHEQHSLSVPKGVVYRIPVVFHVLHNGGYENTTRAKLLYVLDGLNRDFRKLNADVNAVHPDFIGKAADAEIEFVLATIAPDGTCFSGITRTKSSVTFDCNNHFIQVDTIIAKNDVYQGEWPSNKYLNIFVCGDLGYPVIGFSQFPSSVWGTSTKNGVWVTNSVIGQIWNSTADYHILTHEVGHWLNLMHTWGNGTAGNGGNCTVGDAVQDTPSCLGSTTQCTLTSNTCNNDDAYWGFPIHDNVENYMDYSLCSKMFTQGQVDRMRAALNSSIGGRNNLWTPTNIENTGAYEQIYLCKADFLSNKQILCTGDSVQFTDASYHNTTDLFWNFPGGTPATSTNKNPLVTYSTPGIYPVTLIATDSTLTDVETKTNYIKVYEKGLPIPYFDGFENYSSLYENPNWIAETSTQFNTGLFEIGYWFAHSGIKCLGINLFQATTFYANKLTSSPINLSSVTSTPTLSFRYAHKRRSLLKDESLSIRASKDCKETWQYLHSLENSSFSNQATSSWVLWTPNPSDWKTVHIVTITPEYWVTNFYFQFLIMGEQGNNLYLDDINIYEGAPSDNIVLGENELHSELNELSLSPNPTENELNLNFSVANAQAIGVRIVDVFGKTLQATTVNAASGSNLVVLSTDTLAKGTYFVSIQQNNQTRVLKFMKR